MVIPDCEMQLGFRMRLGPVLGRDLPPYTLGRNPTSFSSWVRNAEMGVRSALWLLLQACDTTEHAASFSRGSGRRNLTGSQSGVHPITPNQTGPAPSDRILKRCDFGTGPEGTSLHRG